MNLSGVFSPVVTPFNHEESLYVAKVQHNVSRLNLVDLTGYVVASKVGEGDLLSFDECVQLLELVAQSALPERTRIFAVQHPSVKHAAALIARAADLGYHAALLESPHPGPLTELHARSIADRSPIPVLAPVSGHPNIVADPIHAPMLANAIPYVYQTIYEAERTRELEAAADWRSRVAPAEAAIARYGIPALKHVMDWYGYYGGPPRLPLVPVSPEVIQELTPPFRELKS